MLSEYNSSEREVWRWKKILYFNTGRGLVVAVD